METLSARNRGILAAVVFGVGAYGLAMGTSYPLLGILLHDTAATAWNGLNATATGLGLLLGVLLVPTVCRVVGAGRTMLVGVAAMAAALVAMALFPDFWSVFGFRVLLGFGANLMFVVAETALNLFTPSHLRGRVIGLYTAVLATGFVLGPAVVALFSDAATLVLLSCAAVSALAVPVFATAATRLNRTVRPGSVAAMLPAIRAMPLAFGFLFIASAVDAVMISILPVIAAEQGFTLSDGAWLVTVFHVGLLAGQPLIGGVLDRFGRRFGVLICCAVSMAGAAAMVFAPYLAFWQVAAVMVIFGGTNYGLYTAGLALIGDRFRGASLASATAAFAGVYAVASSLAPVLASVVVDYVDVAAFYAGLAAIYAGGLVIAATVFRPAEPTLAGGN